MSSILVTKEREKVQKERRPEDSTRLRRVLSALNRPPLWCTLAICAAILVWRRPDAFQTPQLWAEDGEIFFYQSRVFGSEAFLIPYAGYLHTLLRIVAWAASWAEPALTPAIFVVAALVLTLYVASRTQSARFPFAPSIGFALAVVMVPDAHDVLLTLTNLQWVLAGGLVLLLISKDAARPSQYWHDVVALVVLGLTGPFVIVLAPLFAWRAYRRSSRFSVVLASVAIGCAAIQAITIVRNPFEVTRAPIELAPLLAVPGVRIGASLLTGGRINGTAGIAVGTVCGVLTIAGVAALATRRGAARDERLWLGIACASLLVVSLYRCRYAISSVFQGAGPRYFFPLQLIAIWLVVATATDSARHVSRIGLGLLALMLATNIGRLREPALADLNWAEHAARIKRGERVTVPINPQPWAFTMPGHGDGAPLRAGLANVSARCMVAPDRPAIVGFTVPSGDARPLLIRAIGPSLARFGVAQPLQRPALRLMNGDSTVENFRPQRNGSDDPAIVRAEQRCRAFALEPGTGDLAAVVMLSRGVFTLVVSSEDNASGEVLVEVYEIPLQP